MRNWRQNGPQNMLYRVTDLGVIIHLGVGIGEEQKILGDVDSRINDEFKEMGKI